MDGSSYKPPLYIPPPPVHHPPPPPQSPCYRPAVHHPHPLPPHPIPHFRDEDHPPQGVPRTPFQQVYPFNVPSGQSGQRLHTSTKSQSVLPSSAINKSRLVDPQQVIEKHPHLMCASKVGRLAVKLAKDSFFGEDIMARCTVAGTRELPALPSEEL